MFLISDIRLQSVESSIINEIISLRSRLDALAAQLEKKSDAGVAVKEEIKGGT